MYIELFEKKYKLINNAKAEEVQYIVDLISSGVESARQSRSRKTDLQILLEVSFSIIADQLKRERYYQSLLGTVRKRLGDLKEAAEREKQRISG